MKGKCKKHRLENCEYCTPDGHNELMAWQTLTLEDGSVVKIQERVLKILGGAEIVLLRASHQTDADQETFLENRQADLMAEVKSCLMHEMGLQIIKIAPIVQIEIPTIEALPSEYKMSLVKKENPKRYMVQIPVLVPKEEKKKGDPN